MKRVLDGFTVHLEQVARFIIMHSNFTPPRPFSQKLASVSLTVTYRRLALVGCCTDGTIPAPGGLTKRKTGIRGRPLSYIATYFFGSDDPIY